MNNILACLGKMLRYAHEVGLLEVVPRVKLLKIPQQKFDFLTFELSRLTEAVRDSNPRDGWGCPHRPVLGPSGLRASCLPQIPCSASGLRAEWREAVAEPSQPPKSSSNSNSSFHRARGLATRAFADCAARSPPSPAACRASREAHAARRARR